MNTTYIRLPRYGLLTLTDTTNPEQGHVTYQLRAPHATGTVIATPCHTGRNHDPVPDGVHLQFGTGDRWSHDHADKPTIYGVPLCSGLIVDPFEHLCRQPAARWIRFSRPTGLYTSTGAPDATTRYMSAIIDEILVAWASRPDAGALVLTVARREAPSRLADIARTIATRRESITQLHNEVTALQSRAAAIRAATGYPEPIPT